MGITAMTPKDLYAAIESAGAALGAGALDRDLEVEVSQPQRKGLF